MPESHFQKIQYLTRRWQEIAWRVSDRSDQFGVSAPACEGSWKNLESVHVQTRIRTVSIRHVVDPACREDMDPNYLVRSNDDRFGGVKGVVIRSDSQRRRSEPRKTRHLRWTVRTPHEPGES